MERRVTRQDGNLPRWAGTLFSIVHYMHSGFPQYIVLSPRRALLFVFLCSAVLGHIGPTKTAFAQDNEGGSELDAASSDAESGGTNQDTGSPPPEVESSQVGETDPADPEVVIGTDSVTIGGRSFAAGCVLGSLTVVHDGAFYGHCTGQLVRIDLSTGNVARMMTSRITTDLFVRGDEVWVEFDRTDAQRVVAANTESPSVEREAPENRAPREGGASALHAAEVPAEGTEVPVEGTEVPAEGTDEIVVISFDGGVARVSGGSALSLRQSVRFIDRESGEIVVGSVRNFEGDVALVRINYGEIVSVGSRGTPSAEAPTGSYMMPQTPDRFRVSAVLSGAFGVSEAGGGGAGLTLDASYRLPFGLSFRGLIWPIHVNSSGVGFNAHGFVGFDMPQFAVAFGIGMMMFTPDNGADSARVRGMGTSVAANLRVGSPDGLFFETFIALVHDGTRFQFGGGRGKFQFPLGHRASAYLLAEGDLGFRIVGQAGVRFLVRGWSDDNPVFLHFGIGGGAYGYGYSLSSGVLGPVLRFGVETHL